MDRLLPSVTKYVHFLILLLLGLKQGIFPLLQLPFFLCQLDFFKLDLNSLHLLHIPLLSGNLDLTAFDFVFALT